MTTLAEAHVSHQTPTRLRVRIPSRKGDTLYFNRVREAFREMGGCERLEISPLTGSVLLRESTRNLSDIADFAQTRGLFRLKEQEAPHRPLSRRVWTGFDRLDSRVKDFTGGEMDISSAAFLILLGIGAYQISIGNLVAPAWYTAFWYAMHVVKKEDRG